MKHPATLLALYVSSLLIITTYSNAAAPKKRSLLNNDPDVIYINEYVKHDIHLLVAKPATVYANKKGGLRLGAFAANTKVELLAISEKSYQVKGKASHAGVTGWVNPQLLASKDKDFIANLKKLYERQMIVKELIAAKEVAIGMTLDEVGESLGNPTETEVKQTAKGETGQWGYVINEEQKHYRTVRDPYTGSIYRQLSHVTLEEKSRLTVEFENDVITTVTRKKNNGPGKIRIVPAPIVFNW